jgi:hypothetical protein
MTQNYCPHFLFDLNESVYILWNNDFLKVVIISRQYTEVDNDHIWSYTVDNGVGNSFATSLLIHSTKISDNESITYYIYKVDSPDMVYRTIKMLTEAQYSAIAEIIEDIEDGGAIAAEPIEDGISTVCYRGEWDLQL